MCTTRLSDELLALAENVGVHADNEQPAEPETKVVKRSSKGVKTK